jgi:hypothetical protein
MSRGRPPDPRKEQFWRDHLHRWQSSGLAIRAYCRRHHLAEASFHAWRRTLARRERRRPPTTAVPAVSFVPLTIIPEPTAPPLELVLANGRCLRIPAAFPPERLPAVLAVLEVPSC